MTKKIPSASITTSALRSVLTNTPGQPGNSVLSQNSLINSKIKPTGGVFAAATVTTPAIDHTGVDTFVVTPTSWTKFLRDYNNVSDKLLPFVLGKGIKDYPKATDVLSRNVNFRRQLNEIAKEVDRPFKGFRKAPIKDYVKESDKASTSLGKSKKEVLTLSDKFKNIIGKLLKQVATVSDKSKLAATKRIKDSNKAQDKNKFLFTKNLKDTAKALDYIGIADKSTFGDSKRIKEFVFPTDKSKANLGKVKREIAAGIEGPGYHAADFYATGYFDSANDYAQIFNPILTLNKKFKDTAYTKDLLTIADGSTFSDIKLIKDYANSSDKLLPFFIGKGIKETPVANEKLSRVISKSLRDFATVRDLLLIRDGSTFVDRHPVFESIGVSESFTQLLSFVRKFNESITPVERPFKGLVKAPVHEFLSTSDSIFVIIGKTRILRDDNNVSDKLLPFLIGKGIKDVAQASDIFKRTTYYHPKLVDKLVASEKARKGFTPATKKEYLNQFDSIKTKQIIKRFKDIALAKDLLTIADGSTFSDSLVKRESAIASDRPFKGFTQTKKEILSKQPEGPAYHDKEYYAIGYFDSSSYYTEIFSSIYTLNKRIKDYAYTFDNLTIADGATYTDSLVKREIAKASDRPFKGFTPATKRETLAISDRRITTYALLKKETATVTDNMSIADGATYTDILRKKETVIVSEVFKKSWLIIRKYSEIITNTDRSFKGFAPGTKKELFTGTEGPAYHDYSYYAIGYFDGVLNYAEVFLPKLSVNKLFKDYAYTKDNLTIADGATYTDALVKRDTAIASDKRISLIQPRLKDYQYTQLDNIKNKQFTKRLKDYAYTIDNLSIADGATYTDSLLKKEIALTSDRPFKGFTLSTRKDYVYNQLDKSIKLTGKLLKEYAFSGDKLLPFTINKRIKETVYGIEGPNRKDLPYYTGPDYGDISYLSDFRLTVVTNKILKDYQTKYEDRPFKGFTLSTRKDYVYNQPDRIKTKSFNKFLKDYALAKDLLTIADGATYTETKILKDYQTQYEDRPFKASTKILRDYQYTQIDGIKTKSFNKFLKDYALAKDLLTIADGATYTDVKILKDYQQYESEGPSYSGFEGYAGGYFNDQYAERTAPTFTTAKILRDYSLESEGPSYSGIEGYAIGYFNDPYSERTAPLLAVSKVFRDFALAKDLLLIADGSTFTDTKLIKDYVYNQPDSIKTKSFNKFLKDTAFAKDLLTITDGSTFTDVLVKKENAFVSDFVKIARGKLRSDTIFSQNDRSIVFVGKLVKEVLVAGDKLLPFYFNKTIKEIIYGIEGPNRKGLPYYTGPDYGDSAYLSDFRLTVNISKILRDKNPTNDKLVTSISKLFKDTALAKDLLTIADGSTFTDVKIIKDYQYNQSEGPSYSGIEGYAVGYFGDLYSEKTAPILTIAKRFKDYGYTFDNLTIADGSTFTDTLVKRETAFASDKRISLISKPFKDYQYTQIDGIKTKSFNKFLKDYAYTFDNLTIADGATYTDALVKRETAISTDRPFKGFTLSTRIDYVYNELDKAVTSLTKRFKDSAFTVDNLSIADGSTFTDTKVLKEISNGVEGPSYHDKEYYAIGYFDSASKYTEIFSPIVAFTKFLKDTAIAKDLLTIADGSTYSEVKVLKDYQTQYQDKLVFAPIKRLKDYQTQYQDKQVFNVIKVLKDYAYATDGGADISRPMLLDRRNPQFGYAVDRSAIQFSPKTIREVLIASDKLLPFTINKRIKETVYGIEGPNRKDLPYYTGPDYGDSAYLSDFKLTVGISKKFKETATALDNINIADTSTFTDAKNVREILTVSDRLLPFLINKRFKDSAFTVDNLLIADGALYTDVKVLKEVPVGIEGPGYHDKEFYAIGYFDSSSFYTEIFNPTVTFTKVLKDYAFTKDLLTIADGSTYTEIKVLKDYQSQYQDKLVFAPAKVLKDYQQYESEGPSYSGAEGYSPGYFTEQYVERVAPIYTLGKLLKDIPLVKEALAIVNQFGKRIETLFTSDKRTSLIQSRYKDYQSQPDSIKTKAFTKFLKDYAFTVDNISIADGSTFSDSLVKRDTAVSTDRPFKGLNPATKKELVNQPDSIKTKAFTKFLKDYAFTIDNLTIADGATYTDTKVLKEVSLGIEGPGYHDKEFYATSYFDSSSFYTEIFSPIVAFTKFLKDYAFTKDNLTITDGSTFTDVKVLADYQRQYRDKTVFVSSKRLNETQGSKGDGIYHNKEFYASGYFDDQYTEVFVLAYNISKVFRENIYPYSGQLVGFPYYADPTYGNNIYIYDELFKKYSLTKVLKETARTSNAGLVSNWNYTKDTAAFFGADFVGSAQSFTA